jgi:hypothetical protein
MRWERRAYLGTDDFVLIYSEKTPLAWLLHLGAQVYRLLVVGGLQQISSILNTTTRYIYNQHQLVAGTQSCVPISCYNSCSSSNRAPPDPSTPVTGARGRREERGCRGRPAPARLQQIPSEERMRTGGACSYRSGVPP